MDNAIIECPLPELPAVTHEKLSCYLTHLALTGRKWKSAVLACIPNPSAFFRAMNQEGRENLKELECEAMQQYCEVIEETVHDRAINGVAKGVWWQGERVGEEKQFSDTLLLALARRHIPAYREQVKVDATVKAGVLLVSQPMTPDEWEALYGQVAKVKAEQAGPGDQRERTPEAGGQDNNPGPKG